MINKDYLYTKIWDDLSSVVLELNALYLYAQDPEDRSRHCFSNLSTNNIDAIFEEVSINDNDQMLVSSNNSIVPLSSADAIGSFNGNVDLRTILNICKDFKLQLRAIPNKDGVATTLKAVKDARNHLAHGDVSYSNFGSTILLSDIIKYKKDTLDFLSFFINRVEEYISNKEYKK